MANWTFDPSQYQEKEFALIPVGDYRVRIADVVEKTFSSGNGGYEITLDVNGYNSKVWFYLVLDASNPAQTNQRIGDFFNCFGITSTAMGTGKQWVGSVGAVRIKHDTYNGNTSAKVAYCINRNRQDNLPAWQNQPQQAASTGFSTNVELPEDLPFDV